MEPPPTITEVLDNPQAHDMYEAPTIPELPELPRTPINRALRSLADV